MASSFDETAVQRPNYFYLRVIGMRLQMKEILEQIKVRFDHQERLAEMDKDRNMKNRIRGQVMYLNPLVVKKTPEEIRNRKTEAPKNMRMKNNRFFFSLMRKRFPIRHVLGLKNMILHKTEQMGVGTLTRLPPMGFRIISASLARLPPSSRSLGSHGNR